MIIYEKAQRRKTSMKWKNMVPLLAGIFAFAGCMAYLKRDRKQDPPKEEDALEDYLAHYEETWKEDGKNCRIRSRRRISCRPFRMSLKLRKM